MHLILKRLGLVTESLQAHNDAQRRAIFANLNRKPGVSGIKNVVTFVKDAGVENLSALNKIYRGFSTNEQTHLSKVLKGLTLNQVYTMFAGGEEDRPRLPVRYRNDPILKKFHAKWLDVTASS